ncbi:MAG: GTP-binding protein [Rhodocyclaceae bacterium]
MRIPVTLLTGFLGSGKTTLLTRLLHDPAMAGAAVLINEVGEVGLDHHMVQEVAEEIVLLESGCLCCTVRGDLSRSLRELFMRALRRDIARLDRVVIETTGLADPAPVIHTLMNDFFLAPRFVLDGVITTADVGHLREQIEQQPEALKQIAVADRVILTKTDLAGEALVDTARATVAAINPTATCIDVRDVHDASIIAGMGMYDGPSRSADVRRWLGEVAAAEQERLVARAGVFGAFGPDAPAVLHDRRIANYVLRIAKPVHWGGFLLAIDLLQSIVGDQLLRVKGLVAVEGEDAPRVFHAVQHERYPADPLPAWPDDDHDTRLVFIVRDLPRAIIERAFASLIEAA